MFLKSRLQKKILYGIGICSILAAMTGCTRKEPPKTVLPAAAPVPIQKAQVQPKQDPRIEFLNRYMKITLTNDFDRNKAQVRFISRDYLIDNKINLESPYIQNYSWADLLHRITNKNGEYIDLELYRNPRTCSPYCGVKLSPTTYRYRVVAQGTGYALLPSPKTSRWIAMPWQQFQGSKETLKKTS